MILPLVVSELIVEEELKGPGNPRDAGRSLTYVSDLDKVTY